MNNRIIPFFLLFTLLISCENRDELSQQIESEYFSMSLPSNWQVFRTDVEESSLDLNYFTTSSGLSVESFKDLSVRVKYIHKVLDSEQTPLEFWLAKEGLEINPHSEVELEGFDSYSIEMNLSVLDEENAINRDYYKSVWCLVGREKTFFIEYGSYDSANFEKYLPLFYEILGSFKER
ncbi:hypothetical protein ACV07N_06645 [Roseivirga echinicomitans]